MRAFVTGGSGFLGRNLIVQLVQAGWQVRALARSDASMKAVAALGAEPVRGDLDAELNPAGLRGCDVVFHSGASTNDFASLPEAWRTNVEGTERVLQAAKVAGVPRFTHVGTEAVLLGGGPIVNADETRPLPEKPLGIYALTKGAAEQRVLAANAPGFATISMRPRFIWGPDDTTVMPRLVQGAREGSLRWIGGGTHRMSTCHVDNVCEGLLLAAERGRPGGIYFLTDGEPVVFRPFIEEMLRSQGVTPPTGTVPYWAAHLFARTSDAAHRLLPLLGRPTIPHASFHLFADEVTVNDALARRELGYVGKVSVEEGLRRMHERRIAEA